jgi:ribosome-binding factor A
MTDVARARRLAQRILVVAAETIERRVKDPRLGFVTMTEAKVTPDLREATIFYTVYGDADARTASAAALESAKGVVRSAVGRETQVRFTPSIAFVLDEVPETSSRLDALIANARAVDDELAKAAADATPAGDPDPYRHPEEDDAE